MLGPILFNIYVNDLGEAIAASGVLRYADDTQLVYNSYLGTLPDLIETAEATLSVAQQYFTANGLILNSTKTQYIFIGTRPLIRDIS